MRRRAGFSLVELLVVIGVIAILLALLLPVLHSVRESANTLKCMSNLRQIGFAIQLYANSNGGRTPNYSYRHEYPTDIPVASQPDQGESGPGWPILIERYLGQNPGGAVWNCPSWRDENRRVNYFLGARWMHNQNPIIRTIPISKIKNSTTYVFAGECTAEGYYPPPYGTDLSSDFEDIDKDDGAIQCLLFFGDAGGMSMHRQGNNVLFADNHVATFKKRDDSALTYSPLSQQSDWDHVPPE